ncbi:tigger transposable element-derived protein 6 [Trichonephila clavipes]|nr:tigger transposable element-derived protein 6 [Trichonephila clavipes]
MESSEKITPLVIGKSAKPQCFKGINSFPTKYRSNKEARMTTKLFNECSSITRFDEYVLVDTDIAVCGALSDAEIVSLDHNNTESDEDESEELTPVTLPEAKLSLKKLRNFFLQNHVDADILQASFVQEKSIDKVRLNALKQKKKT